MDGRARRHGRAPGAQRGYRRLDPRRGRARQGLLQKLLLPANLLFSFWESARHIRSLKPDVVLGLGGYVAFPGGMMASLLNRPLALHEQNADPGLANRVLAQVSDKVMVGFPGALKGAEWTGNPVRAEIAAIPAPKTRFRGRPGRCGILVVGGSLGAQALNEALPKALALCPAKPAVVAPGGREAPRRAEGELRAAGVRGELVAFIDDMARRYAEADLVICRAGAVTIAELSAGGMASILVPFPHAVDDHQTANARFLVGPRRGDPHPATRTDARNARRRSSARSTRASCSTWRARRARSASPTPRAIGAQRCMEHRR